MPLPETHVPNRITLWDQVWQTSSKIHFDMYGYKPHYFSTYRTWVGMVCSICMLGAWAGLTAYSFTQLFTTYFSIQEAAVPASGDFFATYETPLTVPKVHAGFRLNNGSGFYDTRYITITFTQRFTYVRPDGVQDPTGNGVCTGKCVTKVPMDTIQCFTATPDGSSNSTEMRCPRRISRPDATDLPTHLNGELPVFQGQYGDPVYAFLQVEWNFNMTALDLEPSVARDLWQGNTFMSVDWPYLPINRVTLRTKLEAGTAIDSQRWYNQKLQAPRIEWTVRRRSVKSKSAILALAGLDTKYQDYILGLPAAAYSDTPEKVFNETDAQIRDRGLLLKVYFHMDKEETIVVLQPMNTVIAFLAGAGGLVTILALFFGFFGRFFSFWSYTKNCNEAYRLGRIPETYFEKPDGCRLKIEDSNRTVSALNKMQMNPQDMRKAISEKSSALLEKSSHLFGRMSRTNTPAKPIEMKMSNSGNSTGVSEVCIVMDKYDGRPSPA